jgi:integrase/recombinase XerD
VSLNVEDVNLGDRSVHVRNDEEGRGFSGRERSVPISEQAAQAVQVYLDRGRAGLAKASQPHTALFLNQRGQQLTRQGMWLIIKEYAAKANLPYEVTPHVLRHSFAAHMLRQNKASLSEIQRVLGHANISTTQIYVQPPEPEAEPQSEPEL